MAHCFSFSPLLRRLALLIGGLWVATTLELATAADRVDELGWLTALNEQRPDLVTQHDGGVDDPAWRALVLHPRYRQQMLNPGATWDTVLAAEYTLGRRERDRLWAIALRAAHQAVVPHAGVRAGGVDAQVYVGYRIGEPGPWRGTDGTVRKLYLSFVDPERDLSAARLAGFAQHLATRGFDGAFKVDLRPGLARFTYNQLILYLADPSHTDCAESAATAYFAEALSTLGRGVDPAPLQGERPLDWHHFLLTGRYAELPDEVKEWAENAVPPATGPVACPD